MIEMPDLNLNRSAIGDLTDGEVHQMQLGDEVLEQWARWHETAIAGMNTHTDNKDSDERLLL